MEIITHYLSPLRTPKQTCFTPPGSGIRGLAGETVSMAAAFCRRPERGFSHIRNAEQLGAAQKDNIYRGSKGKKRKLSSLVSAHMDKYKCTHEATLTQSSMRTTTHTPRHYCALERLGPRLTRTMERLDSTLQSILLLSTQLSFSADQTQSG